MPHLGSAIYCPVVKSEKASLVETAEEIIGEHENELKRFSAIISKKKYISLCIFYVYFFENGV